MDGPGQIRVGLEKAFYSTVILAAFHEYINSINIYLPSFLKAVFSYNLVRLVLNKDI